MDGKSDSTISQRLTEELRIGNTYHTSDVAPLINQDPQAIKRKGVANSHGQDYLILFVTIKKEPTSTQYVDTI